MLKHYDRKCSTCNTVEIDVLAECAADLREPCSCGGTKEWAPGIASVDAREPFYDPSFDRSFSSYRELEKYAVSRGAAVLTPTEHENLHDTRKKDDSRLNASIEKSYYRLKHGYRDHPASK